ncbi:hypothetical protein IWQ62_006131 [Dispira parvispora]|uniref:Ankyrin repeat domain-containing protein n=1 Tax=Dispira parvispora TaxID=1520584 RepID=A0A9W8AKX4_9FUNG|nr:hypothetical protein IWQ62_006131 [Dispira parvispora]
MANTTHDIPAVATGNATKGPLLCRKETSCQNPTTTSSDLTAEHPTVLQFFDSIRDNDGETVRTLLSNDRRLTTLRVRGDYKYDRGVELQAFKCLGAYIGALTGLQLAILLGHTGVALDILDITLNQDLDFYFGDCNSSLHLAVLLGDADVTRALLERGVNRNLKNGRGFTAVDLASHSDISALLSSMPQL